MSKVFSMPKFDIALPISETNPKETLHGAGPAARLSWLPSNSVIVVDHATDDLDARADLEQYLENGIELAGKKYIPFCMGSGNAREASSIWADEKYAAQIKTWYRCGLNLSLDIFTAVEKDARMFTRSILWDEFLDNFEDVKEFLPPIDIDKVCVLPDLEGPKHSVNSYIWIDGNDIDVNHKESWEETETDGLLLYIIDDLSMDEEQRKRCWQAVLDHKFPNWTCGPDAPAFKGCFQPILRSAFERRIKANGGSLIRKDYFGDEVDLHSVQVIAFESSFKWAKAKKAQDPEKRLNHFSEYQEGFKKYGHQFDVCIFSHHRMAELPYQMMQALDLDEEDLDLAVNRTIELLDSYKKIENAVKLVSPAVGEAIKTYPELIQDDYIMNLVKDSYKSKRWRAAGGRMFKVGCYVFCVPDIVAVVDYIGGCYTDITDLGWINANEAVCRLVKPGNRMMTARNPFPGKNFSIKQSKAIPAELLGLFPTDAEACSMHGCEMALQQKDFDGDKVLLIVIDWIIDAAVKAIKNSGYKLVRWKAQGAKKKPESDENFKDLIRTIVPAPIGIYAMAGTKMKANASLVETEDGTLVQKYDIISNAHMEAAVTNAVDEAKGKGVVSDIAKAISDRVKKLKRPLAVAYAKSSPSSTGEKSFASLSEKCDFMYNCSMDKYSQYVLAGTNDELDLDVDGIGEFKWTALCGTTNARMLAGLGGVFAAKASERRQQYMEMLKTNNASVINLTSWSEWNISETRKAVFEYAAEHGYNKAEAVTALVKDCYKRTDNTEKARLGRFRLLWLAFGEELLQNIKDAVASGNFVASELDEAEDEVVIEGYEDCFDCPPEDDEDGLFSIDE